MGIRRDKINGKGRDRGRATLKIKWEKWEEEKWFDLGFEKKKKLREREREGGGDNEMNEWKMVFLLYYFISWSYYFNVLNVKIEDMM